MKKSVIISIVIIYLLAIVTVGFIGIAQKVYDEVVYVEKIECINDDYQEKPSNDIDGEIIVPKGANQVVIKCRAIPANATNTKLSYEANKPEDQIVVVDNGDGTATVHFKKNINAVIITIKSTDKPPGVSLNIKINNKNNIII